MPDMRPTAEGKSNLGSPRNVGGVRTSGSPSRRRLAGDSSASALVGTVQVVRAQALQSLLLCSPPQARFGFPTTWPLQACRSGGERLHCWAHRPAFQSGQSLVPLLKPSSVMGLPFGVPF